MIPKIIWQTQETEYEDLLPFQKDITDTWKKLNPDWEYRYVSSSQRKQYIEKHDKDLYDAYMISSGINQADIWRLVVTYEYGGFYADMDSVCTMPLNDLIKKSYKNEDMICSSMGFQTENNWVNNSNFASVKNSKVIKLIIDKVVTTCKDLMNNKHYDIFKDPGDLVWLNFCNTILENKSSICFRNNYFLHSKDFKESFDIDYEILYNGKKINYLDWKRYDS